jgi:2-succinyl-6-hydroxy-2,4-cyclohexadiene-1-carboxylate synthase
MSEPLVFLHGFLGAPSMWDGVEKCLESPIANRLVLPGHGEDPWFPPQPADFFTSVDALAEFLSSSIKSLVIGYSMGARVALALALRHPEKISRAILIGVDAGIEDEAMRAERVAWDDAWAERAKTESIEAFATTWENLPVFESQKKLSADARASLREQRTAQTSSGIAWAMRALGLGRMPSLWPLLEKNDVPLTLMSGALDPKFTEKSRAIVTRSKNARAIIVEHVGHNVAFEAPHEVAKAIEVERAKTQ